MSEIRAASDCHCLARGFSTMRLALGYDTGLPEGWDDIPTHTATHTATQIFEHLPMLFPGRRILVWHSNHGDYADLSLPDDVCYMGMDFPRKLPDGVDETYDEYLTAFGYLVNEPTNTKIGNSHFVVGEPAWPNGDAGFLRVDLIIAVSIEGTNGFDG